MTDDPIVTTETSETIYHDDDLVYVNPQARTVIGRVEFLANGKPKPLPLPVSEKDERGPIEEEDTKETEKNEEKRGAKGRMRPRSTRIRYCPWGTYRSMKRVFKLEGKPPRIESQNTLDEVIEKALKEPFWD